MEVCIEDQVKDFLGDTPFSDYFDADVLMPIKEYMWAVWETYFEFEDDDWDVVVRKTKATKPRRR